MTSVAAMNERPAEQAKPTAISNQRLLQFVLGTLFILALAVLVAELDKWISDTFKENNITRNPFEYPLTAVLVGLAANGILRATNLYTTIRPAIRTEFYLKVGLVLLGAKVSFGDLLEKGAGGMIQAFIMVASVFYFTWWLGGKLKLNDSLRAVMASAVSICGVSAAIAAAGAVQAKKEEVSFISGLVILVAIPMMVIMPFFAEGLGLSDDVAGAWFGGNIDTTAAVVGAGTIFSDQAQTTASVVKLSQNVLIGFVAFALAIYFATVVNKGEGEKPTAGVIWKRFPKFVLGFMFVSLLVSLELFSKTRLTEISNANQWLFTIAFVSIGLEFSFVELKKVGNKPIMVFLAATVFNTIVALLVASIIFGVIFS